MLKMIRDWLLSHLLPHCHQCELQLKAFFVVLLTKTNNRPMVIISRCRLSDGRYRLSANWPIIGAPLVYLSHALPIYDDDYDDCDYDNDIVICLKVILPTLASLRVAVYNDSGTTLLGHRILPVDTLRPGQSAICLSVSPSVCHCLSVWLSVCMWQSGHWTALSQDVGLCPLAGIPALRRPACLFRMSLSDPLSVGSRRCKL